MIVIVKIISMSKMITADHSVHGQGPQDAIPLTVGKHLHRHLHLVSVKQLLHSVLKVFVLLVIVTELVQVVQIHPLHEVTSLPIVRKKPDLSHLALQTFVQADEIKLVDGASVLALGVCQLVLAFIVELQGLTEFLGTRASNLDFDVILAVFTFL